MDGEMKMAAEDVYGTANVSRVASAVEMDIWKGSCDKESLRGRGWTDGLSRRRMAGFADANWNRLATAARTGRDVLLSGKYSRFKYSECWRKALNTV